MTTIRGRRRVAALLASTLAGTLLGLVPASAQAADNSPPLPQDDELRVLARSAATIDVLANDTDPDGDELAICRLGKAPRGLLVERTVDFEGIDGPSDSELTVVPLGSSVGKTFTIDYFACDFDRIVRATLTVRVVRPPQVEVDKVDGRAGLLRVSNPSRVNLKFLWAATRAERPDGRIALPAGSTATIRVQHTSIVWVAARGRFDVVDIGRVRGIRLPRDAKRPEAPTASATSAADRAWSELTRG